MSVSPVPDNRVCLDCPALTRIPNYKFQISNFKSIDGWTAGSNKSFLACGCQCACVDLGLAGIIDGFAEDACGFGRRVEAH